MDIKHKLREERKAALRRSKELDKEYSFKEPWKPSEKRLLGWVIALSIACIVTWAQCGIFG